MSTEASKSGQRTNDTADTADGHDSEHRKRKRSDREQEKSHKGSGDGILADKVEKYKKLWGLKKKEAEELQRANEKLQQDMKQRDGQRTEDASKNSKMRDELARLKREVADGKQALQQKTIEVAKLTGKLDTQEKSQAQEKRLMEKSQEQSRENLMTELKDLKVERKHLWNRLEELQKKNEEDSDNARAQELREKAEIREELRRKTANAQEAYDPIDPMGEDY